MLIFNTTIWFTGELQASIRDVTVCMFGRVTTCPDQCCSLLLFAINSIAHRPCQGALKSCHRPPLMR